MYKHDMIRWTDTAGQAQLEAAGWSTEQKVKAVEEVIRLKPPVKNKSTVKDLQEANINKGDE